jgi:hypothetical protein
MANGGPSSLNPAAPSSRRCRPPHRRADRMRPYFAPRVARPDAPKPAPGQVTDADLRAAWSALVTATRPHWPGGIPGPADMAGMTKRICNRFGITDDTLEKALSIPV